MLRQFFLIVLITVQGPTRAQIQPAEVKDSIHSKPLVAKAFAENISVRLFKSLSHLPVRIVYDSLNAVLYTCNTDGNVFRIPIINGTAGDETVFINTDEHKINYLQGMVFFENTLILVGNNNDSESSVGYGLVEKCTIRPDGSKDWITMLVTEAYPSSGTLYDHAFAGVCLSPAKDSLYIASGSRTDHGEIKDAGIYTGLREVPLTAKIFRIPVNAVNVYLPNNDEALYASGYVFASGVRNEFDMAFAGNGHLFGVENSGDRDDPEELNWLRHHHHYGFPWRMGGNDTPMQFAGFRPEKDKLIPADALKRNIFYNDAAYPQRPGNVFFTEPVKNLGPDANWLRDPTSGKMYQCASITTFTGHRSPVGLVFDVDSSFKAPFKGAGFVLAYSPEEAIGGYSPEQDRGGDLCWLQLIFNTADNNYQVKTTRLVSGFFKLTDAEKVGNELFITDLTGKVWRVAFR
ncbi:hypothetical protein [Emticicia sp. TH156]|uniref:hypothetical protein n=1 Tax=Emticicia sp. TH156 TaxID=2067454 RepID=UPI000C790199|nr:hypothetical protein [Emticicia sp. TH156]PLK45106.1 hypothetical protein C0V77_07680 [Emticicia sp. TH156]